MASTADPAALSKSDSCMQVPNIKGAESLSISEIAAQLWRLQKSAEEGQLHQEDLEGITLPCLPSQLHAVTFLPLAGQCTVFLRPSQGSSMLPAMQGAATSTTLQA